LRGHASGKLGSAHCTGRDRQLPSDPDVLRFSRVRGPARARVNSCLSAMLALLTLGACAQRSIGQREARPNARPFVIVPLGLCQDYPEESRSIEEVRRDLALLRQTGVRVLRVSFGWDGIEPERGRFDFSFWDAFVAETTAAGVRIIPYVAYTPSWAATDGGATDYWRRPPRDLGAFRELMQVLATRYRGRIRSWEIWNEPDNPDFWRGSVADYAALLTAGAGAVRSADPQAKVVFGGIAGHPQFAAEVLASPPVGPLVDVVNAHAYFETWNGAPLESLPSYVASFAPALGGGARALWLAEVGYSDYRRGGVVSADVHARFAYEHTPAFQAVQLVRTVSLALTRREVALLAWYEIRDSRPDAAVIGDDNNRHLGVTTSDGRPKPALAALGLVARLFGDGFARLDDELRVTRPAGSQAEVHAFLTAAHHAIVFAWLPEWTRDPVDAGGEARDDRREKLSLSLPLSSAAPGRVLDAEGREQPGATLAVAQRQDGLHIDDLDLRGGTVVVIDLPVRP
jgi:polysaccharide biosynthesis protein PslG